MHERISIHHVCFLGASFTELAGHWRALGTRRVTLISPSLLAEGGLAQAQAALASGDYRVETVCHIFTSGRRSALRRRTGKRRARRCCG